MVINSQCLQNKAGLYFNPGMTLECGDVIPTVKPTTQPTIKPSTGKPSLSPTRKPSTIPPSAKSRHRPSQKLRSTTSPTKTPTTIAYPSRKPSGHRHPKKPST